MKHVPCFQIEIQPPPVRPTTEFRWSVKVDRVGYLDAFTDADFAGMDEAIVDGTRVRVDGTAGTITIVAEST